MFLVFIGGKSGILVCLQETPEIFTLPIIVQTVFVPYGQEYYFNHTVVKRWRGATYFPASMELASCSCVCLIGTETGETNLAESPVIPLE